MFIRGIYIGINCKTQKTILDDLCGDVCTLLGSSLVKPTKTVKGFLKTIGLRCGIGIFEVVLRVLEVSLERNTHAFAKKSFFCSSAERSIQNQAELTALNMTNNFLWTGLPTVLKQIEGSSENCVASLYSFVAVLRLLALDNPSFSKTLQHNGIILSEPIDNGLFVSSSFCWFQQGEVKPSLAVLAGMKEQGVEPEFVDFRDGLTTARKVNASVAAGTKGQITALEDDTTLAYKLKDAIAVYLNTLSFIGKWKTPFNPQRTYAGNFHAPHGDVSVEYMVSKEEFSCVTGYEDLCSATVGNCLQDGDTLFCAMMPHPHVPMRQLLERLAERGIQGWSNSEFELHLPKFALTGSANMHELFPSLVPESMPGLGLHKMPIAVLQKCRLAIDENGVEAAAATAALMGRALPVVVTFDRPFLVLLLNGMDEPIFAGVVNNPVRDGK